MSSDPDRQTEIHRALTDIGNYTRDKWQPVNRLLMCWPLPMLIGLVMFIFAAHRTVGYFGLIILSVCAFGMIITIGVHQKCTENLTQLHRRAARLMDDEFERRWYQ